MNTKKCNFKQVLSWAAVAAWMVVIFLFSAQTAEHSGNASGAIVRWWLNRVYRGFDGFSAEKQEALLEIWHTVIRKGAHFTEYAVLAVLIANAVRSCSVSAAFRWLIPIAASALYAVSDEIHQYFVPGRACRFLDVCIDTAGAACGTGLLALTVFLISKRKCRCKLQK